MTLEEAKKLKPGDRVLVEMTIRGRENGDPPFDEEVGTVSTFVTWINGDSIYDACHYLAIREKIAPPRRKFRAGDVVRWGGVVRFVIEDEDEHGVLISVIEDSDKGTMLNPELGDITLICAVEDRVDRKESV